MRTHIHLALPRDDHGVPFCCLIAIACLMIALSPGVSTAEEAEPVNIALGKKYVVSPAPNYVHCTDPEDTIQLTDGKAGTGYFWTQKGTVGWRSAQYVTIRLDLEKIEPISGIELTSAAGTAGVFWPRAIFIQVSDDGKTYRNAGELMRLDRQRNGVLPESYAIRCLSSGELQTRGRFVRLIGVPVGPYFFTDEIRVFRGDPALLDAEPSGEPGPENIGEFVAAFRFQTSLKSRFDADRASQRTQILETKIPDTDRTDLLARLESLEKKIDADENRSDSLFNTVSCPENFRTIFPMSELHAELFRIQAAVWAASGLSFHVEAVSPWDKTPLFFVPKTPPAPGRIDVHAMRGEYRSAAFNLYNASQEPMHVRVRINGIPATEFTLHDIPWTDTAELEPVLAALPEVVPQDGVFSMTVHPGLVKQVWMIFRPKNMEAQPHAATIIVETDPGKPHAAREAAIPLTLRVWPFVFPEKATLLTGGWSYTNGNGAYSVTLKNRPAFLEMLKEHFINAPWARPSVVMNFQYDKESKTQTLDTKEWDDWQSQWPDATEYCIFLSVGSTIKGIPCDAPEFDGAVAAWISAWVAHWRSRGIEPERINLLVADEPGLGYGLESLVAWSRAIRKAEPKLKLWTDPVYTRPKTAPPEVFDVSDVICPNRTQWLENKSEFEDVYLGLANRGKTLQLYSCSGPVRLLDPYAYFRLQAWQVARINGTGSFFWAMGDGNGVSSWNEYVTPRKMYTPLFLDPSDATVVSGKQLEAIREGTQDYETIHMLRSRIKAYRAAGKPVGTAETVLQQAFESVLDAEDVDALHWKDEKDRSRADAARIRLLEALVNLPSLESERVSK